jgi:predicted nucleic acid-binding protein
MRYYFDTSVWIAYLNKDEFFHKEAEMWFEKIRKEKHELYVSDVVDHEMRDKPQFKEYLGISRKFCKFSEAAKEDNALAIELSKETSFHPDDIRHILHAKRNNFIAVSADYNHWPTIAKIAGYWVMMITWIYP